MTIERPWEPQERPRADAIVTRVPGLAIGVTTADCGPVLLADADRGRHRRRPCRLARRRDRRAGSDDRRHGALRRRSRPHRGRARADDPPAELRGRGRNSLPASRPTTRRTSDSSSRRRGPDHALFDLPGYIAARSPRAGISRVEDLGHCTYADPARFFSYRRSTHRRERDYGRHINAIALANQRSPGSVRPGPSAELMFHSCGHSAVPDPLAAPGQTATKIAEPAGKSMQSGSGQPRHAGYGRRH